jgi:hypothetical protein
MTDTTSKWGTNSAPGTGGDPTTTDSRTGGGATSDAATTSGSTNPVSTPAQTTPDQYYLRGSGISFAYYPNGTSSRSGEGFLHATYRDSVRSLAFYENGVRLVEVPDLGTIVSVTIFPSVDTGNTTFSVLIPDVFLPDNSGTVPIETLGITTMEHVLTGAIGHPQRKTYTVAELSGTAGAGVVPPPVLSQK